MRLARPLFAAVLAAAVLVPPAAAQAPRPMTLVDLIELPSIGDPQLSPDGRQVLYVRSDADWEENGRTGHIWRVNADGTGTLQLTNGEEGESNPRWSPDGRTVAFLAERGEDERTQIWLIPNAGGEARRLTEHPTSASSIQWSPDGAWIYFLAEDEKTAEEKRREEDEDDVYAFDEDYEQRHVWRLAVADGATQRITEGEYSVLRYDLSRDGAHVAHHRAQSPLFGHAQDGEVWIMGADGGGARQLTRNGVGESGASLSPDGRTVLFTAFADAAFEPYFNDNLFVVPAEGGPARDLTAEFPHEVGSAAWAADGRSIYFVANMGVHSELFRADVGTGSIEQLTRGEHALRGWSWVPGAGSSGMHVFQLDTPMSPGEIHLLMAEGGTPRQVTRLFDHLATEYRLPRVERITWAGQDGVEVEGLLWYPLDYRPGTRYPLVVQTHGGPASSDQFGFPSSGDYVQVLAARGWAVLQPNYRGSTGYGDRFLRDMVPGYFDHAHLDVMAGVDHVIALGVADPERMVKMGWSAGGHMTNKIITWTDRFKAAASGAGAANWVSMYAQSDVRSYRTPWFGGTPWEENAPMELYWEHSPLRDAWRVETPTIFLVGVNDARVPMPQSVEMYRALLHNGVPTHLYVAPREGHGWRELRHRLFKANVELDWFERWALGREYEWERAPGKEPVEAETAAASTPSGAR